MAAAEWCPVLRRNADVRRHFMCVKFQPLTVPLVQPATYAMAVAPAAVALLLALLGAASGASDQHSRWVCKSASARR